MNDQTPALRSAAQSVKRSSPMFSVPDMAATVRWYTSIGFTLDDRFEEDGELVFARLSFGASEFALGPGGQPGPRDVSFWFFTNRVATLYEVMKRVQPPLEFAEELYEPFYGGQQFSIRDCNGMPLVFWQPKWLS